MSSPFVRMYVRWPGARMHLDERARIALAGLTVLTQRSDVSGWAPDGKKRPVIDPADPGAADVLRSLFAKDREPGWTNDPDDGFGNRSCVRVHAADAVWPVRTEFEMQAGSEPITATDPVDGNDYAVVDHWDDAQYRHALKDQSDLLAEFNAFIGAIECGHWATLTLHSETSAMWRELWDEIGRNYPMGSAMWFADKSGWDLSAVPEDLAEMTRIHNGTLIVARTPAAELDTDTALILARAVRFGEPAHQRERRERETGVMA